MKKSLLPISGLLALSVIGVLAACNPGNNKTGDNASGNTDSIKTISPKNLELKAAIPLPDVKGGFDLMALDLTRNRLFVAAEDNHTVEVLDLKNNRHLQSLTGFNEPKWIFYCADKNRIYVATGDGKVTELDGNSYKTVNEFRFKEACNNLRFDPVSKELFVGVGKSFGALGIIDLSQDKIVGEIPLSGYLKQFELDGDRIYVNVKDKNLINVVSRKAKKVIASWPVEESTANVPMALDRINQRLFIGCEPGKFIVFATSTGKPVASLDISKEPDGIYSDTRRGLIYVSCGEGNIEIIKQENPDSYTLMETMPTVEGAATSLFSADLDQLILAVPQAETQKASIRIYKPSKNR